MDSLPSTPTLHTILFATDFSAAAEEAFHVASSLPAEHRARLIIAHVARPEVPGLGMTDSLVLHDDYLGAIEARLRAFQGRAPHVPMQFRIEQGRPSIEIVKLARAAHADLIVLGTQRGDAPPLPPSTSQEVLLLAPCAVSVVKPKQVQHTDASNSEVILP